MKIMRLKMCLYKRNWNTEESKKSLESQLGEKRSKLAGEKNLRAEFVD